MRCSWLLVLASTSACSFTAPTGSTGGDDDTPPFDTPPVGGRLVPSNQADTTPLDAGSLGDLTLDDRSADAAPTWRIYTETGAIDFETSLDVYEQYRNDGTGEDATTGLRFELLEPNMAVLFVDRLRIDADVTFEGHGSRALVIVARDSIEIGSNAIVDFRGGFVMRGAPSNTIDVRHGGPGGGNGAINDLAGTDVAATGCGAGGDGDDGSGGGGGGGGSVGGDGGDKAAPSDVGGTGGLACIPATLVPLVGGSGGGAGDIAGGGGDGGGGGGALQLTSLVSITIDGTIDVAGVGGRAQQLNDEGGGGGGAGGGILLEAPTITLTANARIVANGGGGGSGREALNGAVGQRTAIPAKGGDGSGGGNADGRGGAGGAAATPGQPGDDHNPGGGGGGGGFGVIRFNTDPGKLVRDGMTVVSPDPSTGNTVYR